MKIKSIFSILAFVLFGVGLFAACGDPYSPPYSPPSDDPREPNQTQGYTISFEANGGVPAPQPETVKYWERVSQPAAMTKDGFYFGGWYKEEAFTNLWDFTSDFATANIILYAKWVTPILVPGESLNAKLRWIDSNVENGGAYTIEVDSDQSTDSVEYSYSGKKYITIIQKGKENEETLKTNLSVGSGVTLILEDLNFQPMIGGDLMRVNNGGNLILNPGVKISNLGVYVDIGGTLTMNGGEISGNSGGGVYVGARNHFSSYTSGDTPGVKMAFNGTFTMNGGKISGNNNNTNNYYGPTPGGGVSVDAGGIFTMNDGEISGNSSTYGGGVYVYGSSIMHGSDSNITIISGGTFNKTGGTIYG